MKKVFTTGQVAKICKVAPRTVSKWFETRAACVAIASPARRIVAFPGSIFCGSSRNTECPWAISKPRFIIRYWLSGPFPAPVDPYVTISAKLTISASRRLPGDSRL